MVIRRTDLALAVAVFAASLGLLAAGSDISGHDAPVDATTVLLVAAASLPLAVRRSAPLAVFVVMALASTALHAIAQPAGPPLGPTIALFFLGASGERVHLTWAVASVLLVAHAAAAGLADDRFPGVELLFGIPVWGGAWLAGDRSRLRRERLAAAEERALRAEREAERERRLATAEERTRIARDLHDSAGHAINVILVHAGLGRLRAGDDAPEVRKQFEIIEQVARETIGEIEQMVGGLREDGGVEPPAGLAALDGLVARHREAGLEVTARLRGERRPLPGWVDRGAYRILQEALTNAARHGAGRAEVEVVYGAEELALAVSNPVGDGASTAGGGHGVVGMRERAAQLGGALEAGRHDGRFDVRARLPL